MPEDQKFRLPHDGYETIEKILHSYYLSGARPASLDDVANRAGMHRTVASRNAGFLIDAGLLTEGREKQLTEQGRKLASAISNGLKDDIVKEWRYSIQSADLISPILDMIRIRRVIPVDELAPRIASTLKEAYSGRSKTGYSTLIEVFQLAGLLVEDSGNYKLSSALCANDGGPSEDAKDHGDARLIDQGPVVAPDVSSVVPNGARRRNDIIQPQFAFNIQVILPEHASAEEYDDIFRSIAVHLLGRNEE